MLVSASAARTPRRTMRRFIVGLPSSRRRRAAGDRDVLLVRGWRPGSAGQPAASWRSYCFCQRPALRADEARPLLDRDVAARHGRPPGSPRALLRQPGELLLVEVGEVDAVVRSVLGVLRL